jgi:hypothetical protein
MKFAEYLEKCVTITEEYSVELLVELNQRLFSKHRGKLSKALLFLENNVSLHKAAITHKKLADLHFEVLKHPTYSPDLVPSDCRLIPDLK